MMQMIGNVSRTAFEVLDLQATDIWNEFSKFVRRAITLMEPLMVKIDYTLQQIQEGIEIFANKCYNLESVDISPETVIFTSASILLLMVVIATVGSFVVTSVDDEEHGNGSSPAKVLSIFELAKTAYINDHGKQVMRLVDMLKFDVNFPIPTTGMSLLLCSCISGEKQLVEFLLDRGGDISHVNSDGDSCLYLATFASGNNTNCALLRLLIEKGCKVNGQNYRGNTPLHLAASRGYIKMIDTLLNYGADPQRSNNIGIYPHDCAANAGHTEAAQMLKNSIHM